jgi:extradiol dioxygenase family protein
MLQPFHLAIPVHDIAAARAFYGKLFGCPEGRSGGMRFVIEPGIRFAGEIGEQATMFFYDPSGNAIEFKAFKDQSRLFSK